MQNHSCTHLIALDWGTTTLRAFRLDGSGDVADVRTVPQGISRVAAGEFESVLFNLISDWLGETACPVIASGMIGSQQGWFEVPYVDAPAGLREIVAALRIERLPSGLQIAFVPGVSRRDAAGQPDVMRGEETQCLGALTGRDAETFVLPGTHSKWVREQDGKIGEFRTFLTGELFAMLRHHSLLARSIDSDDHRADGFARGLQHARRGRLLNQLFATRAMVLAGDLGTDATSSYLSGLLIGHELNEALTWCVEPPPCITIIGGEPLSSLYDQALTDRGLTCRVAPADAAARGLYRVSKAAGLFSSASDDSDT